MFRLADRILEYLASIGVEDIFTVSGGGSIFLNDAMAKTDSIAYFCCHHEQAVAMATEGYARAKGGLGVSVVTTGPGGTNAITGVAGSWIDSVPHLVLSGQVFYGQTVRDTGLRQLGVQELNIIDLVKPITKYAVMVTDPKEAIYHVQKAVHLATSGRPGPVWIDIPADIQNAKLSEGDLRLFAPDEMPRQRYDGDMAAKVADVVELCKGAKRPLIHLGQGVKIAGAVDDFFALIERHKIPFITSRNANQLTDWDHPLYVGRSGTFAQRGANFAVQNSDVYIAVGTRLALMQTGYNTKDYARNAKKVLVDVDRAEVDKNTLDIDIRIHSDAKEFLAELTKQMDGVVIDSAGWVGQCQAWKKNYPVILPKHRTQLEPVNSYYFIDVLSNILGPDDIVVTDMGLAFQGTHQAFRVKKGQKLFTNSGFAAMGWGLPAAVGASIACGKGRVICISGDGGLQLNIQELATIMHNNLPVKLFIYSNGGYLTIKQTQELGFEGRLMGCNEDSGLSFPDFVKVGQAHGIKSLRINSQENLEDRVREIVEFDGPVVCDLVMDPDQEQMPKAVNRRMPDGTMKQTSLEDLYPFLDEEELKQNMIADREQDEGERS
jgi:acetolactate synthase I/II/III large subunit